LTNPSKQQEAGMTLPSLPNVTTTSLIVDLSHYEAVANLSIAESQGNVIAVFLKATEGATYQDPAFLTLYDRAKAAGLKIGVYHFGTARPPTEQVSNFVTTVTRIAGGFEGIVVGLDIETNTLSPDNTMSPDQGGLGNLPNAQARPRLSTAAATSGTAAVPPAARTWPSVPSGSPNTETRLSPCPDGRLGPFGSSRMASSVLTLDR
jgi:hypothetical protein